MDELQFVPIKIFLAEMCVVTLGTLRIIFVSRGQKYLAPCLGFFEVTIWLFAITQVMQHLDNVWCFLAFASGFTTGNFLGIIIEKSLAMGLVTVRIIAPCGAPELARALRQKRFGVTCVEGEGAHGPVQVILSVAPRRKLKELLAVIEDVDPGAFYSVDELQSASAGIFPTTTSRGMLPTMFEAFKRLGHSTSRQMRRP